MVPERVKIDIPEKSANLILQIQHQGKTAFLFHCKRSSFGNIYWSLTSLREIRGYGAGQVVIAHHIHTT